MENQSLRPTPLAFTQSTITGYNLYADLQHVHRILCLISFDFSNRVFLNIFDGSYYAETQHLSEVFVQIQFRDVLSISPKMMFSGIFIGLFRWNAACTGSSMQHSSRIFYESSPWPLISISRNSWQLIFEETKFWSHFQRYNQPLSRV